MKRSNYSQNGRDNLLIKKKCLKFILAINMALLLVSPALATILVTNGDFETPIVTKSAGWDIFNSSEIPGWTVSWSDASCNANIEPHLEFHNSVNSWTDISGAQYVEMDTDCGGPDNSGGFSGTEKCNVKINQSLSLGDEYSCQLKFYYSPRPNHQDNQLKIYIDGNERGYYTADGSGTGDTNWSEAVIDFNVDGDAEIAFEEVGTANSFGMFLDNIRVICEPVQSGSTPDPNPIVIERVGGTSLHINKLDLMMPHIVLSMLLVVVLASYMRRK